MRRQNDLTNRVLNSKAEIDLLERKYASLEDLDNSKGSMAEALIEKLT